MRALWLLCVAAACGSTQTISDPAASPVGDEDRGDERTDERGGDGEPRLRDDVVVLREGLYVRPSQEVHDPDALCRVEALPDRGDLEVALPDDACTSALRACAAALVGAQRFDSRFFLGVLVVAMNALSPLELDGRVDR